MHIGQDRLLCQWRGVSASDSESYPLTCMGDLSDHSAYIAYASTCTYTLQCGTCRRRGIIGDGYRVLTITCPYTTHTSMPLETLETFLFCARKECLFLICVATVDPEADVHSAANRLARDHSIHIGVFVKCLVDQTRLFIVDLLLATDPLGSIRVRKLRHDLPSNPYIENG